MDRHADKEFRHDTFPYILFESRLAERLVSEHFENELVNSLLPVIKPKFAFVQMKIEDMLVLPTEAREPRFGKVPKTFNPDAAFLFRP